MVLVARQSRSSALAHHLFLAGPPGCGKTTALRRAVELLDCTRAAGFLTVETRAGRQRTGFQIITLDGTIAPLASLSTAGPHRVGRYGVSLASFERVALASLAANPDTDLYVIDEIGRMECLSPRFTARVSEILDGALPLVGTVGSGSGFPAEARRHAAVELLEVTPRERDTLPERIAAWCRTRTGTILT